MSKGGGRGSGEGALTAAIAKVNTRGVLSADFSRADFPRLERAQGAYAGVTSAKEANAIATGAAAARNTKLKLPPITVVVDRGIHVPDGRHRVTTAAAAGATKIRANVTVYTRSGARLQKTVVVSIKGRRR